jgi:MYXO-CTERM domain-containing protein
MSYKAGRVSSGNVLFIGLSILALLFFYSGNADAFSQYYVDRGCAGCHGATPTTCDGCHHHGSSGLQAQTDKGTYTPGEALGVTFDGGSQTGWIRAILYLNNAEVARSTGTGSPPRGGSGFPILFNTTAPATPGTYTYQAAWFGNSNDTGSTHGEVRVSTNSFTVTAGADTTPPTVSSTSPANNATGVAVNTAVTATFNEPIAPATVTAASFTLSGGVTGTVSLNPAGTIATFTPSASLANSTTYTATLTTAITDVAGNALAANHVWSFTTGAGADTTPPTVTSRSPDNNTMGVAVSTAVTGTFNEAIAPATLTAASFLLRAGVDNVTGTVSLNPAGTIATFTPSASLANSTTYTVTLTTAITDVAGNALAANHVWTFTTAAAGAVVPPTAEDDDGGWFGCAISPSGGGNGGILGTYGPLILLALGIAFRRRVQRRKE